MNTQRITCNKCGKRIRPWYFTVILCLPVLEWNSLQYLSVFNVTVQLLEEFYPMCYYMQLVCMSWKIILPPIIQVNSRYIQLLQVAEASMFICMPSARIAWKSQGSTRTDFAGFFWLITIISNYTSLQKNLFFCGKNQNRWVLLILLCWIKKCISFCHITSG
jgi:hypothetical protein